MLTVALPGAARPQACQATTPAGHAASLDYRMGPALAVAAAGAPVGAAAPVLGEAGFTYLRRVAAGSVAGANNLLLVGGGWHNGRLSGQSGPDALTWHASTHATVASRLFSALTVCAHLGAGYQRSRGGPASRTYLEVPFGVGVGLALPFGGLTVLPYAMPTAAYFVRTPTDALAAAVPGLRRSGRDLALSAGVGLRFGRLEVQGGWRIRDERLNAQPQFRLHAVAWF